MGASGRVHGHLVQYDWITGRYVYDDDGSIVKYPSKRPCPRCGQLTTVEGHDMCLGILPGVEFACCGHGYTDDAYVAFNGGHVLRGEKAIEWFKEAKHD